MVISTKCERPSLAPITEIAGALAGALAVLLVSGEAQALCIDEAVSDMSSGDLTSLLALFAAPLAVLGFLGLARKARSSEAPPPEPVRTAPAH